MLVSFNPLVSYMDNFLTDEECDHLIELSKTRMERATVASVTGEREVSSVRTNSYGFVPQETDEITMQITAKASRLLNVHPKYFEHIQVIHYAENEEYKPHQDSWPSTDTHWFQPHGARVATVLFYLNTPELGGGTNFPNLGRIVSAKKGRVVVFYNTHLGSQEPNDLAIHGGMPVIKGEKWAANLWLRTNQFQSDDIYQPN